MEHENRPALDIAELPMVIDAREKQITTLAKLLAEINEKLVEVNRLC